MSAMKSVSETSLNWAGQRDIAAVFNQETGSTNEDAKKNALKEVDPLTLYLCAHQTQGRGRGANTWLDNGSGENLLSTWSFALPQSPQAITAPRIGLALFQAAHSVWPSLEWSLKAPNDLYLNGHKVGGLLIESVSLGAKFRVLLGLGLNILNHPRIFAQAAHMGQGLALGEGDWFQFLDELRSQFELALQECMRPELNPEACKKLAHALNANVNKPYAIMQVSAQGDLIHSKGQVRWTEL